MNSFIKKCNILILCSILTILILAYPPRVICSDNKALIFIEPDILTFPSPGENFSIIIKVSHATGVSQWQIAMEFNHTVANLTAWGLPQGHIFEGKNFIQPDPAIEDSMAGRKFVLWGAQLLVGKVDVPDTGVLCRLNFTTIGEGHTKLKLGTEEDPVLTPTSKLDPSSGKYVPSFYCKLAGTAIDPKTGLPVSVSIPLEVKGADVTIGRAKVAPVAYFELQSVPFNKEGVYLVGSMEFFVNKPIIFNASKSYDLDGEIVAYEWDFGDGNITVTNSSIFYYTYSEASRSITITLRVHDNDGLVSAPFERTISVGMTLTPINYVFYLETIMAIIIIVIVLSMIRRILKYKLVKRKSHFK